MFISHSSRDGFVAGVLAEKVQGSGAKVWLDAKDLAGGSPILETVMETVDKCQEAVVLVSPQSVNSQWVLVEIGAFLGQHKRVTQVLNHVDHTAIAPIQGVRAIELDQAQVADFVKQLTRRVLDHGTIKPNKQSRLAKE